MEETHAHRITQHDIQSLLADRDGPCVSLFLPTHQKGADTRQDPIRLKNLLKQAEEHLEERGFNSREREELLAPGLDLLSDRAFLTFWQRQYGGLALFIAPGFSKDYRLTIQVGEQAHVGPRFYTRPLLASVNPDGTFFLLALDKGGVTLYRGSAEGLSETELPDDIPTSFEEALRFDDFEKHLQFHTTGRANSGGGQQTAQFHGHSDAGREAQEREFHLRFFQHLDNGVREVVEQIDGHPPLVLAGVEKNLGYYREVNKYSHLIDETVSANPRALDESDLHERAWALVAPRFEVVRTEALGILEQLLGQGDSRATLDPSEAIPAAFYQRVDTLFLPRETQLWGQFDEESGRVDLEASGDEAMELLDFAAAHTLLNGGRIFGVDAETLPNEAPLAAVLRY